MQATPLEAALVFIVWALVALLAVVLSYAVADYARTLRARRRSTRRRGFIR